MAANDIVIAGAIFPDVPKILLPVNGGGTAAYTDVSDTDAVAADVAAGKYFYNSQGQKTEGTASGGGGTAWDTQFDGSVAVTTAESNYYYGTSSSWYVDILENSVWRVTWNGTPYTCTATFTDPDIDNYALGDPGIVGGTSSGNNEPFYIARMWGSVLVVFAAQSGTYSVKLEKQVSGGGGADCPTFTINYDDDSGDVLSASCDKTYAECISYLTTSNDSVTLSALIDSKFYTDGEVTFENITGATGHLPSQTGGNINYSVPDTSDGMITARIISFSNNGTITVTEDPVDRRTSNDLTASTLTVTAPAGYYASDATKTLTDSNLSASNIKKDVSIFNVTGTYEGGGGGGSNWTQLATQEYSVNTTSTTATSIGNITIGLSDLQDTNAVIWVHVRDKAGKRSGYFYGSDTIFFNNIYKNNSTGNISTRPVVLFYVNSSGAYTAVASSYGVYARYMYQTSSNHYIEIYRRYNSSYGTINGTFKVEIYKLSVPSGFTLFA